MWYLKMEDLPSTCGNSSMGAMMINHGIWGGVGFSMIFTRFLGDLKVETEDCSPGVLKSCRRKLLRRF